MTQESMTIHEALCELKLLDKRIFDKIDSLTACYSHKKSAARIQGRTIEEMNNTIRADWESVNGLLRRRAAIRNAVARSNGTTFVTIGGREYTVSEAIEMKDRGIVIQEQLLSRIEKQYRNVSSGVDDINHDLDEDATDYAVRLFGSKDKASPSDVEAAKKVYTEANTEVFEDPLNLKKQMESLRESIDTFQREVSSRLSVSNALTVIEISY